MSHSNKEYYFKEGCYIEEWLNQDDQPEMSVAKVRVLPQQTTKLHRLIDTAERYIILSGEGVVTVGSRSWAVKEKSVVIIPPGAGQKISNTQDSDLVFLAICTPRFEEHNYQQLET